MLAALSADPAAAAASPGSDAPPLLVGPRARVGMTKLVERANAAGRTARVFGFPARFPANRDALLAGGLSLLASTVAWASPTVGMWAGAVATAATAALAGGLPLWPRSAAWTVIVGHPGPATRRVQVLALDERHPRRWLFGGAAAASVLVLLAPGLPATIGLAAISALLPLWDPARARSIGLDAALAWVLQRPEEPGTLTLVTTAGSGYGEGILAVLDWFEIDRSKVECRVDEASDSGVKSRLAAAGVGRALTPATLEGADVVAGDRARG